MHSSLLGTLHIDTCSGKGKTRLFADVFLFYFQEEFYGVPLIIADREQVESLAHQILKGAEKENVALLVVGDPFAYE